MKAAVRSRFSEHLLDARRNRRVHRKRTRPWWHSRHYPPCDRIECPTCRPWQGAPSSSLNARGLWLFAHDWLERLSPFDPRLRGPLAAHVIEALGEHSLWSLPDLPFLPAVSFEARAPSERELLRTIGVGALEAECSRAEGRATVFIEGIVPIELWLPQGPHDELAFLGPAATHDDLACLVARFFLR